MSSGGGPEVAPELDRARSWSAALAAVLDEVTEQIGVAARRLADGWPDVRGDEWAQRLYSLGAALHREADAAVEFGRAIDRLPEATPPADDSGADGPRLGDTGARRADDRRGVTIPRWTTQEGKAPPGETLPPDDRED